jgi:hypothetical protein
LNGERKSFVACPLAVGNRVATAVGKIASRDAAFQSSHQPGVTTDKPSKGNAPCIDHPATIVCNGHSLTAAIIVTQWKN